MIVAATTKHPIEIEPASDVEVIALYLESEPILIDAQYHLHIPTWPARSADPEVDTLAAYLKKEREPQVAKPTTAQYRKLKTRWAWIGLPVAIGIGIQFLDLDSLNESVATVVQPHAPSPLQSRVQAKGESQIHSEIQPPVSGASRSETFENPNDPLPSRHAVQPWLQASCPIALTQSQKALSRYACIRCKSARSDSLASSSL